MPLMAGDLGFVTGLQAGRNQGAASAAREWKAYSQGLSNQITALSQQLQEERAKRGVNRADVAGMTLAINALPPEIREMVKQSIAQHYDTGFVRRALELGLPQEYAAQAAGTMRDATIKAVSLGPGR